MPIGSIISIILTILKLVDTVTTWIREQDLMDQGRDAEIARATAVILAKTQAAKKIMEEINGMDEKGVDALLASLELAGVRPSAKT